MWPGGCLGFPSSPPSTRISKEGKKKSETAPPPCPEEGQELAPSRSRWSGGPSGSREGKAARLRVGSSTWQPEALAPAQRRKIEPLVADYSREACRSSNECTPFPEKRHLGGGVLGSGPEPGVAGPRGEPTTWNQKNGSQFPASVTQFRQVA